MSVLDDNAHVDFEAGRSADAAGQRGRDCGMTAFFDFVPPVQEPESMVALRMLPAMTLVRMEDGGYVHMTVLPDALAAEKFTPPSLPDEGVYTVCLETGRLRSWSGDARATVLREGGQVRLTADKH
jgi:hypothetical protein